MYDTDDLHYILPSFYNKELSDATRLELAAAAIHLLRAKCANLQEKYDKLRSDISWEKDQASHHRMGL